MRANVRRFTLLVWAWMLAVAAIGCDVTSPSNLSPTPSEANDRHEQAVRYSEQRARKIQEAERKILSRKTLTPPPR
jgi:hypothetical protein